MVDGARGRGRMVWRFLLLLVPAMLAAACTPAPPTAPTTTAPGPAPALTAAVEQFRDTYTKRIIELQLTNTAASPLAVLAASLEADSNDGTMTWPPDPGGAEIPPGQTLSLPLALSASRCASTTTAATAQVRIRDGARQQTLLLPAADPHNVLDRNRSEDCVARAVAAVAAVAFTDELTVSADGGSARLHLGIRPAGGDGSFTVTHIASTPLLSPAGMWPVGWSVAGSSPPRTLDLGIVPARCDAHALAEDKVGTVFRFTVRAGSTQGVMLVPASPLLKTRLYGFVAAACRRG
ncbi:hypothetical protein KIH31_16095 [Paenarthrobacter sp. DKR-5]|uniref:hypothetical protein n=1 Tax=Paenarthrobacter sp. DKR-5 TaxID=2835535 RepID=UPI001BDD6818|nr:hypothetical protein [Paenarthrobacter sp. DKR-5]MBT1004109.1 hypothetical protein [Paenarthrobacter sp. DKR-5]